MRKDKVAASTPQQRRNGIGGAVKARRRLRRTKQRKQKQKAII